MMKTLFKNMPAKLVVSLLVILAAYVDTDFRGNTWAQIVTAGVLLLLFFGEVVWKFLSDLSSK
ncbi:MAG: hypothetical protein R8G34_18745 [Paracoccaceae bacterium]|nr:hypothetical protein [Paracoccaceae bacterium]